MPPRVLIVDDESDMVENCVRILGRTDYECRGAADPLAALGVTETRQQVPAALSRPHDQA
jgi:PleD family two-component response regulator